MRSQLLLRLLKVGIALDVAVYQVGKESNSILQLKFRHIPQMPDMFGLFGNAPIAT